MKKIRLSSWITCIVDDEDFDYLNQWKWSGWEYAKRKDKELGIIISMHRIIMGAKHGDIIDHINGNKTDNRVENLRYVTQSENLIGRKYKQPKRLNRNEVIEIKTKLKSGNITHAKLAVEYGTTFKNISNINTGFRHKSVIC